MFEELFQSLNSSEVDEAHATHADDDVLEEIAPEASRSATVTRQENDDSKAAFTAAMFGCELFAGQFMVALLHAPPNKTHLFSWQLVH